MMVFCVKLTLFLGSSSWFEVHYWETHNLYVILDFCLIFLNNLLSFEEQCFQTPNDGWRATETVTQMTPSGQLVTTTVSGYSFAYFCF